MKKILLASAILVIFFLASGVYAAAPDPTGGIAAPLTTKDNPKANEKNEKKEIEPYSWDFGTIKAGEIAKHDFVLKNESQGTINIKEVTTSCGCTTGKLNKTVLGPDESTTVEITFNSKGIAGGSVQKYAFVRTDNNNAVDSLSVDGKMLLIKPSVPAKESGIQPFLDNSILRLIIKGEVKK
ncbi:MAG: DUF1573 domain-containing protein [Candidatus Omnitrophica bacterium]|nr:DUF1573 domain-containing protein [Candidatus Omnitrophota bacterium]